jgi:hypothetical protein
VKLRLCRREDLSVSVGGLLIFYCESWLDGDEGKSTLAPVFVGGRSFVSALFEFLRAAKYIIILITER